MQETGWSFSGEWSTPNWHFVHSSDKHASILIMLRTSLVSCTRLSTAVHIPGRLLQVRLHLHKAYDLLAVYQHSWNPGRGTQALCQRQALVWKKIQQCMQHIPNSHFVLLAGDFNSPLQQCSPYVRPQISSRCSDRQASTTADGSGTSADCYAMPWTLDSHIPPWGSCHSD